MLKSNIKKRTRTRDRRNKNNTMLNKSNEKNIPTNYPNPLSVKETTVIPKSKSIPLDYSFINKIVPKVEEVSIVNYIPKNENIVSILKIRKQKKMFDRNIKVNNNISNLVWEESHINELEDLFNIFKLGCNDYINDIEENVLARKFSIFIRECSSGEIN